MNRYFVLITLLTLFLFLGITTLVQAQTASDAAAPTASSFFSLDGSLAPGGSIQPAYPVGSNRHFNFSLAITGGGPVELTLTNSQGATIWNGAVQAGETVWGSGTLTPGNNTIRLQNTGGASSDFLLSLYNLPPAPYTWSGEASSTGLNSHSRMIFPEDGLYTFDLQAGTGRYQFYLNNDYLQKTVEDSSSITTYVPAGTHDLTIIQDAGIGAGWSIDVSAVGAAADVLPYHKDGGMLGGPGNPFAEAWLPIHLAEATPVNLSIALTGDPATTLHLDLVNDQGHSLLSLPAVHGGETLWATANLPTGTSRVYLEAAGGNVGSLSYDLAVYALESPPYTWQGKAHAAGLNSRFRLDVPNAALYTFALTAEAGRYQFQINDDYILKTVEQGTTVNYYLPAGTHDLTINQDSTAGAGWKVDIIGTSTPADSLPYHKSGGLLGGSGNDFDDAWLPIYVEEGQIVNARLEALGNPADTVQLSLFPAESTNPAFDLPLLYGGETVWTNFALEEGVNRLYIMADGANLDTLGYELTLSAVPEDEAGWDGHSFAGGLSSRFMVDFSETGVYQFEIMADPGFANLVLDQFEPALRAPQALLATTYQITVTAGLHEVITVQDPAFPAAAWSALVTPVTPDPDFFTFSGIVEPGVAVTPQFTLPSGEKPFNFEFSVTGGGPVTLNIQDSSSNEVWNGSAVAGETLWGTGTLTAGSNPLLLTNTGGAPAEVTLTLYSLPEAPYQWQGTATGAGQNSHIRVTFPEAGLVTFNLDADSGRYQFLLNNDYIQKTVETDTSVTYFVPAGTHDLLLDQDSQAGSTVWSVDISDLGAAQDTLPYSKAGGLLGGTTNDFDEAWLPVTLTENTALNLSTILTGTVNDNILLEVYNSAGQIVLSDVLYAGETLWSTFNLPAGTSRIHLLAEAANADALAYALTIHEIPGPAYTWAGTADAQGSNSHIRLNVPQAGLYTFDLVADSGRYQFQLDEEYLLQTVEDNTAVTYYVPAGTHHLYVSADDTEGANWLVEITAAGTLTDTMPYIKEGGLLGGLNNQFTEAWLPVYPGKPERVNVELTLAGASTDALTLALVGDSGVLETIGPVSGGETVWSTFNLPANGARLHLETDGTNNGALSYQIALHRVPQPSYVWQGLSYDQGINSTIRQQIPISGVYQVEVYMPRGFTSILIDSQPDTFSPTPQRPNAFSYDFEVALSSGYHTFTSDQDPGYPVTDWVVTTTLLLADAPSVTAVAPDQVPDDSETTVTITGANFMEAVTVALEGDQLYPLGNVAYISSTQLTAVVPTGLPDGIYDLLVTNPDEQNGRLENAITVVHPAPEIDAVLPASVEGTESTVITVTGAHFLAGATVTLQEGGDTYLLEEVTVVSGNMLKATVPATVPAGIFDVIVRNPDTLQAVLLDGLSITRDVGSPDNTIYLPLLFKAGQE